MLENLFKKTKFATVSNLSKDKVLEETKEETSPKPDIKEGSWIKCDSCGEIIYKDDLEKNLKVCPKCNKHFRLGAYERINMIVDEGTLKEFDKDMVSKNPLDYPGYLEKLDKNMEISGINEAVVTGSAKINDIDVVIAVMDGNFLMGSMGSVVGEKITNAIEYATKENLPLVIFTVSGGARMQEGIISLMQMAKTSSAIAKHNEKGLLYITVLTDPTTGGVSASFAMLGDIILSEPDALICFAGPRVIKQTIKQNLPEGFQKAEFLQEHGFVDKVVERKDLKQTLSDILDIHKGGVIC